MGYEFLACSTRSVTELGSLLLFLSRSTFIVLTTIVVPTFAARTVYTQSDRQAQVPSIVSCSYLGCGVFGLVGSIYICAAFW